MTRPSVLTGRWALVLLALCALGGLAAGGCAGAPSATTNYIHASVSPNGSFKTFTYAVYNVENLFDVFDDPYTRDESTDVKPREDVAMVAAAIRKINADVVGLVEVENEGVVRAMVHEFLGDMGYRYIGFLPSNDGRGIGNGVISRYPIRSMTTRRWRTLTLPDDPRQWSFARDLAEASIEIAPGVLVDIFVMHFKSKHTTEGDPQSAAWRLAEARESRQVIEQRIRDNPRALILFTGDLNDTPDSPTLAALLQPAEDGLVPLFDLHAGLPEAERMTYLRGRFRGQIIDYILASPAAARAVVPGSARVFLDEDYLGGADHAPVVARFRVPIPVGQESP